MSVLPIRTARLHLRMMRADDAATAAWYRNLPEIARYQDWKMPYSVDDARRSLSVVAHLTDVTDGQWVSVAIERDGEMIGDVAVGLVNGGRVAQIGYTLAPAHHGQGYASEAVGAVIDALFERSDVVRAIATLDPNNHASLRLLENLGFREEGLARQAEFIRGVWEDDLRMGLLKADRAAWLDRPRSCGVVELRPLDETNLMAVVGLETHRHQRRFVSPMAKSFAEALVPPQHAGAPVVPWYRAIVVDGEVGGFMMTAEPTPNEPEPYLWRLLIDRRFQRRGVGAKAVAALIDRLRTEGHRSLLVSFVDEPGGPRPFYEGLGFELTGEVDDGELVARLVL